ncbi:MAG: hypothetical protein AAF317_15865 [Pseudomonadota bacterium]
MASISLTDIAISLKHMLLLLGSIGIISGATRAWNGRANPIDYSDPKAVKRKGFEHGVLIGVLIGLLMIPSRVLSNQPVMLDLRAELIAASIVFVLALGPLYLTGCIVKAKMWTKDIEARSREVSLITSGVMLVAYAVLSHFV